MTKEVTKGRASFPGDGATEVEVGEGMVAIFHRIGRKLYVVRKIRGKIVGEDIYEPVSIFGQDVALSRLIASCHSDRCVNFYKGLSNHDLPGRRRILAFDEECDLLIAQSLADYRQEVANAKTSGFSRIRNWLATKLILRRIKRG